MHVYGDKWFQKHEQNLCDAMDFIAREFKYATGIKPMMKEKYGHIVFEMYHMWLTNEKHFEILKTIIQFATVVRWPNISSEIYREFYEDWSDDNGNLSFYN